MTAYEPVPLQHVDSNEHRYLMASAINNIMNGGVNVTLRVRLNADAMETVVKDMRIYPLSFVAWQAETDSADAVDDSINIRNKKRGEMTIQHSSSAATDMDFTFLIIG